MCLQGCSETICLCNALKVATSKNTIKIQIKFVILLRKQESCKKSNLCGIVPPLILEASGAFTWSKIKKLLLLWLKFHFLPFRNLTSTKIRNDMVDSSGFSLDAFHVIISDTKILCNQVMVQGFSTPTSGPSTDTKKLKQFLRHSKEKFSSLNHVHYSCSPGYMTFYCI